MKTAQEPFRFRARFVMSLATGRSARNMAELRAGIAELPESVIYRHTYHFLAEHEALVPEPPNDFSLWVSEALGEEALAERLGAVVDPTAPTPPAEITPLVYRHPRPAVRRT